MIIICLIFPIAFIIIMIFSLLSEWRFNKSHNKELEELYSLFPYKRFSITDYYERIEKENDKILREKESQEKYTITLWFGNDGCRLNDDGEVIWIKKNEPKKVEFETYNPYAMCNTINPLPYQMQGAQSTQSQIDALQSQMCSLQAHANQQYQNELLLSQLNSVRYCPSYTTYPYSFIHPYSGCCGGRIK